MLGDYVCDVCKGPATRVRAGERLLRPTDQAVDGVWFLKYAHTGVTRAGCDAHPPVADPVDHAPEFVAWCQERGHGIPFPADAPDPTSRRLRVATVPVADIAAMLANYETDRRLEGEWLPADAVLECVRWSRPRADVYLWYSHPAFAEVPAGGVCPYHRYHASTASERAELEALTAQCEADARRGTPEYAADVAAAIADLKATGASEQGDVEVF